MLFANANCPASKDSSLSKRFSASFSSPVEALVMVEAIRLRGYQLQTSNHMLKTIPGDGPGKADHLWGPWGVAIPICKSDDQNDVSMPWIAESPVAGCRPFGMAAASPTNRSLSKRVCSVHQMQCCHSHL